MNPPILTARGIAHTFDVGASPAFVLKNIDLDVFPSEILMLVGPSGSGKTTLMHILGQLLRPTSGTMTVCGELVDGLNEDRLTDLRLQHFGFVFQDHNLFPMLTATENVMIALDLIGFTKNRAKNRAQDLLEAVGLSHRRDAYPGQLSIGQRQRVAVARALAADPDILIADEPTASLDTDNGIKAMDLLQSLIRDSGRAIIVVTHDARILRYANRIVHLIDGRITDGLDEQPLNNCLEEHF